MSPVLKVVYPPSSKAASKVPEHIVAGYKGVITRDDTSDEAKEKAQKVIEKYEAVYLPRKQIHEIKMIKRMRTAVADPTVSRTTQKEAREKLRYGKTTKARTGETNVVKAAGGPRGSTGSRR